MLPHVRSVESMHKSESPWYLVFLRSFLSFGLSLPLALGIAHNDLVIVIVVGYFFVLAVLFLRWPDNGSFGSPPFSTFGKA